MKTVQEALMHSYTLFDFFCAAIILILLYTTLIDIDRTSRRIHLANLMVSNIMYCIADIFWGMAYYGVIIERTMTSRLVTNVILHIMLALSSYTIFRFIVAMHESMEHRRTYRNLYIFIPFFVMMIFIGTTPWTHIIFSIAKDGTFIKNILFFPLMIAMYGYVIYFALRALMLAFKAENEANKTQYLLITVYSVPITAGMILRYYYLDVPTFSIGATISTLIIYIFEVRGQVSLDALTDVNNRRIGERFFIKHIQEINSASYSSVGGLYLFMIDLNKFKSINDTFGHAEGDRALVTTAEALKEACNPFKSRCNLSRFGGDEFVIGAMLSGAEESEYLTRRIEDAIIRKNAALNAPYTISVSIGCERYKKDYKTLKTFLSAADKMMYKEKEKHHLQWNLKTAKKRKNR